jgi:hypothetical protein
MIMTTRSEELWVVPELGPSLGRLVDPPPSPRGALRVPLDDIRLDLVTGVFDLAGASRSFAAAGDHASAIASLGRVALLGLWEKAGAAAATRIVTEANAGLRLAAEESRFPQRRLQRVMLSDEDTRAIGARLGSGGAPFVAALDDLQQAVHGTGTPRGRGTEGSQAWQAAVSTAARRLESAWLALEETARLEQEHWAAEIARVRGWHRPTWPVWLITAVVLAAAIYLGLVLGGYLPVPTGLEGFAGFWWSWP